MPADRRGRWKRARPTRHGLSCNANLGYSAGVSQDFKAVLWDVDLDAFDALHIEGHARFLVRRVLEHGTWDEWTRLIELLGFARVEALARALPRLEPRALAFASAVFRTPRESFACFNAKPSSPAPWIS